MSLALGAWGCGDGDGGTDAAVTTDAAGGADAPGPDAGTTEEPTIADLVVASDDFDILEAAILRASPIPGATPTPIAEALDAPGAFTVFAPNDAAFEASGFTLAAIEATPPDTLRGILLYHGLLREVPSSAVTAGAQTTIAQLPIFITTAGGVAINGGNTVTGGANVITTDVEASNGVVHVIDRVLLPPTVEAIARYAGFSTLAGAVASQGLTDDLSGAGPFTVFAPTNEAFTALGTLPTGDALTNVLLYHVIGAAVPSSAIAATPAPLATLASAPYEVGGTAPSLSLLARLDGTTARINGTPVVTADIPAINGVVHVVGEVLLPMNIVDIAEAGGFSTLVTAVGAAAPLSGGGTVAEALSSADARFTVFAPTNAAFTAAFPSGLPSDGAAVRDVLLYHVLASPSPGIVLSTGLPAAATDLPTLLGATLPFAPGSPPTVDGEDIVVTDIVGTNGVVHAVSGVLLPPT
ncbi:MAG: fasciclin domain-containing protein [Sandaracinaceae bacterium]|nr:fasciclin domain-containing protein [Sandaracinaceae bacterium]